MSVARAGVGEGALDLDLDLGDGGRGTVVELVVVRDSAEGDAVASESTMLHRESKGTEGVEGRPGGRAFSISITLHSLLPMLPKAPPIVPHHLPARVPHCVCGSEGTEKWQRMAEDSLHPLWHRIASQRVPECSQRQFLRGH